MIKSENAKKPSAHNAPMRTGGSNSAGSKGKKIDRCFSFFFAGLSGLMLGGVVAFGAINAYAERRGSLADVDFGLASKDNNVISFQC